MLGKVAHLTHTYRIVLDEWLRKRSLRDRTGIHYLYPLPRVFPIETVAEVAASLLEEVRLASLSLQTIVPSITV